MRFTFCLILWVGLSLFTACRQSDCPPLLATADSLCNTRPDSAITWLESIQDSITSASEPIQMYYLLLRIKAHDKAYLRHTSDSLILSLVKYYQHNNRQRLPETLYYAGRIYSDLKDAPLALEYYQKAIDILKKENSQDWNLLSRLYSQVGKLYLYQEIPVYAYKAYKQSLQYNSFQKDHIGIIYNLRDIARSFTIRQQLDSAIYYYKKADDMAQFIHNPQIRFSINGELAAYYTETGKYKEAYQALKISLQGKTTSAIYRNLADYFYKIGKKDSAILYYNRLLATPNYYNKARAFKILGKIAQQEKQYDKACHYFDKYHQYMDSLQQMKQTEVIHKMNSLYNYQLYKKENEGLKIKNIKQRETLFHLITLTLVIITLLTILWQRQKRKSKEKIIQQKRLKKMAIEKYKISQKQIESNKKEIEKLTLLLEKAESSNNILQQNLIIAQKDLIEKTNIQIEATLKVKQEAEINLLDSLVYKKFHQIGNNQESYKITNQDWKDLQNIIDETYTAFTTRIYDLYILSEKEFRVCLLTKIGITPTQMADILCCSKQAITSIRKRLYAKIFKQKGSTEEWDNFIKNF